MNYLPFLFLPFFFFFDTSINEHPIAYVRSIKKSMKPAFFLNLIPDFFSLFFNKNSSRYIYIYIFIHSRLSFHLDFAITPLPFITRSQRLFLGQNGIPQKWGAGRATISPLHGAQKSLSPEKWTRFAWFSAPILPQLWMARDNCRGFRF